MSYPTFSTHAPTGSPQKFIVSPNQYSDAGRNIGFPTKYSVYVTKISEADGSQVVTETREVSDLVGNRLYLWHRPVTLPNGTPTTISVGGGGSPVVDSGSTNARSAYIVFSTLPTTSFTVSYLAAPDCVNTWNLNTLQDDVMEMQQTLGVSLLTGSPGLRNLAYATFDVPDDANYSGIAPRAVYLSHLARDIIIGSTDDASLMPSLGTSHRIQIGRGEDSFVSDVTGFHIVQSDAALTTNITLGSRTGDVVTYRGMVSGQGPLTVGGPAWAGYGYSGFAFSPELTEEFYTGAMLRVHGDVAVAGGVRSIGPLVVVTTTGTTSIVLGDWTVQDELFVFGTTHLNGNTIANTVTVENDLTVGLSITAANTYGDTLIDNLDCSEVAHTYNTVIQKRISNCVIDGPHYTGNVAPKLVSYSPYYRINNSGLIGDVFVMGGYLATSPFSSGAHPSMFNVTVNTPFVSGCVTGLIYDSLALTGGSPTGHPLADRFLATGQHTGVWSPGMMEPGSLWMKIVGGQAAGYTAPIYNYKISSMNRQGIENMVVFCPESTISVSSFAVGTDPVILYNPGSIPYRYIYAEGGALPTFAVTGSTSSPLKIAFDDQVRIMTSPTSNLSLLDTLEKSVSGMPSSTQTGVAYIFASADGVDPESPPLFKARPVPFRLRNETAIGEVVASKAGGTWSILDTTSYRPNGVYDSSWIPIVSGCTLGQNSGRFIPSLSATGSNPHKFFFQHNLGPDATLSNIDAQLYMATVPSYPRALTGNLEGFNQTHTYLHSFQGQDVNGQFGPDGRFVQLPISTTRSSSTNGTRDSNIFYIDSKLVGIQFYPGMLADLPTGYSDNNKPKAYQYLRVVLKRDA